jgi:hypothetical protein
VTPRLPAVVVVLALVLAALGGRFGVHMLQLARQGLHADFATLYTGAQVYRESGRFYDAQPGRADFGPTENRHVLETARRLGTVHAHADLVHVHVFSYPPFTVLPFLPFTLLPFRAAAVMWQALSLGFLALSLWCLWRAVPLSPVGGALLIALALLYEPLENSLGLGQINLLILALTSVFLWALVSGRAALAGVSLGLAVAMRLHPAIFFVYLAWRRKWAPLAWGVATAAGCTGIAILLVGWQATVEYATVVAPKYARAFSGLGNLSLTAWLTTVGPTVAPSLGLDAWRRAGQIVSVAVVCAAFWWLRPSSAIAGTNAAANPGANAGGGLGGPFKAPHLNQSQCLVAELGFVTVVLYLVLPNTTINHLVFLLIPLALLVERAVARGERGLVAALAVVVLLVAAIDDYYMHPRLHGGPQILLGGIKTYGLVLLGAVMAAVVRPVPAQVRS